MRIALLAPDDLSTLIFCRTLARVIRSEAPGVEVFTVSPVDRYRDEIAELPTTHLEVDMERFLAPVQDLRYLFDLARLLRKGSFDILLAFSTKPNIYGALAGRLAGVPRIAMAVRGLGRVFGERAGLKARVLRRVVSSLYGAACSASHLVWFTNENDLRYFVDQRLVDSRRVFLTPNAVDLAAFSPEAVPPEGVRRLRGELGMAEGERAIVMVARMIWSKGIREFAEAAALLCERRPDLRFLLVAPLEEGGPDRVPAAYVREAEKRSRLRWLGFRKDVRELYALSDLAVLPSYYREGGYPRALLEPMAMGKPVIAGDTEDCRSPVEEGRNGYRVPVKDPPALARAIERIAGDEGLRREFGRRSREKAEEEFDDRAVARQVLSALGVLGGAGGAAAGSR